MPRTYGAKGTAYCPLIILLNRHAYRICLPIIDSRLDIHRAASDETRMQDMLPGAIPINAGKRHLTAHSAESLLAVQCGTETRFQKRTVATFASRAISIAAQDDPIGGWTQIDRNAKLLDQNRAGCAADLMNKGRQFVSTAEISSHEPPTGLF